MHGFTRNFYQRCVLAKSQGDFISKVTQVDLHCHLEVTVAEQGGFGIKSSVVQKWPKLL